MNGSAARADPDVLTYFTYSLPYIPRFRCWKPCAIRTIPNAGSRPPVRTIASLSSRSSRSPSRAGVEPTRAASAAYSARNSASEMAAARTVDGGGRPL